MISVSAEKISGPRSGPDCVASKFCSLVVQVLKDASLLFTVFAMNFFEFFDNQKWRMDKLGFVLEVIVAHLDSC